MINEVTAYLGLGSNLNHPQQQLSDALTALSSLPDSTLLRHSSLYRSKPMLGHDSPAKQPDYINAVAAINTCLSPLDLLDHLQEIEAAQGRARSGAHWGPRTLDLDLLLYGQQHINNERLVVPHAGLAEREFVLYPLAEIASDLQIPTSSGPVSVKDLVANCPRRALEKLKSDVS